MNQDNPRDKFDLPIDVSYLNCAYMGPTLKASRRAGDEMMLRLSRPYGVTSEDFFKPVDQLRTSYAQLINCADAERIALVPSVSYGSANIVRQVKPVHGSNVVMAFEEFPSSVHPWRRLCKDFGCSLRQVHPPNDSPKKSREWTEAFLKAIDEQTAAVVMAPLHWADGTLFDLEAIREKCRRYGALFFVDGSQSIGVDPFNVAALQPDAVVNAGYKWLFSPYGASYAYYGDFFDEGIPVEENWITHEGCEDFSRLVDSNPKLLPKGRRYSAGQHPSLVYVAMQQKALDQILEWDPEVIQKHCSELHRLLESKIPGLDEMVEEKDFRANHLFGIHFSDHVDVKGLKQKLDEEKIFVSMRGEVLRISLHLFNTINDMERLAARLKEAL